jgi:signal peptidase I
MAMFTSARDVSLLRHLNRELMGNIITQQCAIYQFKLEETKVNLYGEAAEEKYYNGPFLFNVLINRNDQSYPGGNFELITQEQNIDFFFLRDDLVKADVVPEVGDIILYQESYYGVQSTISNQYWGGKNPSYPNNDYDGTPNPLNPGLENFGESVSILASTYYIPSDKVSISPYKERF